MKKLSFVMTAVLALLLLASCSKKQGSRLIPDNAIVVARFDLLATMEKTGMRGDDTSLKDELEKAIKKAGLDKEVRDKVLEIIDDPTASGIDFTEPLYAYFASNDKREPEGGLVGAMASKSDLTDLLQMVEENSDLSVEEYDGDGVMYLLLDRTAALIYNDDWFYLGTVERDGYEPDVDATIETLLDRASGNSNIEEHKAFQVLNDRKGLMQLGFFGSGLEDLEGLDGMDDIKNMLPEEIEMKDIAAVMDLIINDGEILIEAEAVPLTDEVKEYYEKSGEMMNTITDDLAKYVPKESSFILADIDVKTAFKNIRKVAEASGMRDRDLQQFDEVESIVNSLTGQAVVFLDEWDGESDPAIMAYVGTKNSDLIDKLVSENMSADTILSDGLNRYRIPVDYDYEYVEGLDDWVMTPTKFMQVGWDKNLTYFLINTDKEAFARPQRSFTDVKGIGMYARVSGKQLGQMVASESRNSELAEAVDDIVECIELYAETPTKGVMRLATNKKDKSPIVIVADYVKLMLR